MFTLSAAFLYWLIKSVQKQSQELKSKKKVVKEMPQLK